MKVHCGILLFLCVLSICSAAPLTCEQLLTKQNRNQQQLSGTWYLHAASTDSCIVTGIVMLMRPSLTLDITFNEAPKQSEAFMNMKMLSYCVNDTSPVSTDNNIFSFAEKPVTLLPSSCSDCVVVRSDSVHGLLGRKPTIDDADLKEFELQSRCANLPRFIRLNSDYDFTKCNYSQNPDFTDEEKKILEQRVNELQPLMGECIEEGLMHLAQGLSNVVPQMIENVKNGITSTINTYIVDPITSGWNYVQSFFW